MNDITDQIHMLSTSKDLQEKIITWIYSSKIRPEEIGLEDKEIILMENNKLSLELNSKGEFILLPGTFMAENVLTNLLPILNKGLRKIMPYGSISADKVKRDSEEISSLIEKKRSMLKEQYKEAFSRLRKRIEREIDQTKYNSLQAFSRLSKEISNFEGMPELNLQLNPIEIYDAFNHIKNSLKSILTNHSVQLEEELTLLVSELITSLERKVHLLSREINEKNKEVLNKLSSERIELERKRKDLKRQVVRETEILKYEIEKLLKKLQRQRDNEETKDNIQRERSEEEINSTIELFRQGVDQGLIIVRKELEKAENKIKQQTEEFINSIVTTQINNINNLVSQHSFLQKEQNDIFNGINTLIKEMLTFLMDKKSMVIRVSSENQYEAKSLASALEREIQKIHDKIIETINDFLVSIEKINEQINMSLNELEKGYTISKKLIEGSSFNKDFNNLGKKIDKLLNDVEKNKKPEKLIKQIQEIKKLYNQLENERKEENELINGNFNTVGNVYQQVNDIKSNIDQLLLDKKQEKQEIEELLKSSTQQIFNKSNRLLEIAKQNEEIVSDCVISAIEKIQKIDNHFKLAKTRTKEIDRGYMETLQKALGEINRIKEYDNLEFWKKWGNTIVDNKNQVYSSLKHHFERYLDSLPRKLREQINTETNANENNGQMMPINIKQLTKNADVLIDTYSENIIKMLGIYVSPAINVIEIAETISKDATDTILKQLQSDIISLKEDLMQKREQKSKEIEKEVEAINIKLVHSFNQLEDKLGKIIENLLESYDLLSGFSPNIIKATYLNVNETLDRLMNSIQTKLLEEVNEAHETLLKNDPFLEIENKVYEMKHLAPEKNETVIKEKLTKQVLYPVNEMIRDLGIFNGNILMRLEKQQ